MLSPVLDHDEERALAEIEANLRMEAPELQRLMEAEVADLEEMLALASATPSIHHRRSRAWARAALAFTLALVAITVGTLAAGPDLGGLIGAIALTVASTYAYQVLRGCPGRR